MLPQAPDDWTLEEAAHLVRRAGFGGSPGEIRKVHSLGRHAAVASLLDPDEPADAVELPDWASREAVAAQFRQLIEQRREARMAGGEAADRDPQRGRIQQQRQRENRRHTLDGQAWWFERMRTTRAPLREKMVLFWHDHFATSVRKVKRPGLMMRQNETFRRHAMGSFRELTHAMLHDPAMLFYLDTQTSVKGKPNENFAREVMELFTLGEGHYGEDDIREAARAFTGYTFDRREGTVVHRKARWDGGRKEILGRSGNFDGDQVIDLLFEQPAAASHLCGKLWNFFVADAAPPAVTKRLAKSFRAAGFEVKPVLREIFLSRAFYDPAVIRDQIKSPIQFLLQALRELELDGLPSSYLRLVSEQLGQTLFVPPNVAGWDWGKAWINTNTLLGRYNAAGFITTGSADAGETMAEGDGGRPMVARRLQRVTKDWKGPDYEKLVPRELRADPGKVVDALVERLFQADPGAKQRAAFLDFARSLKGAIFTNHEVAQLCHLMMSTPHYQLC